MAGALIGALRVSLSAETTAFEAGMKKSQRTANATANSIERSLNSVGRVIQRSAVGFLTSLTIGSFIAAGKASLEYAGHLGELADTLGLTTKDLQTFSYAAGQVGVSQEELEAGIQKLTISMGKAEVGSKAQVKAFEAIGISIDDIKGKNAGDVFRLIAERLEKVGDRSQRAAVEVALFGKAGAKLDNLLSGSQGRLGDLAKAAEELGIVLSDEQIRKADETADKIQALETVLKAQIAGEVANNADSILDLANSLATLSSRLVDAGAAWRNFNIELTKKASLPAIYNQIVNGKAYGYNNPGKSVTVPLPDISNNISPKLGGDTVGNFLAPSGGRGSKHSGEDLERKRLDALRASYDYARNELSAQKDILEAKKDLATDYVEQTSLSIAILDLERAQYKADLDNQVAENRITKGKDGISQAQEDHLLALYDQADHDKRLKVLNDEEDQRLHDVAMLEQHAFDRRREMLEKQADLATTQSERRKIELDILKLAYEEKRQALQRIVDNSKDAAEIEDARRDLLDLNRNYAADKQGVLNRTRNPLEEWASTVPKTAAEINEAFQSIEAQGLDGLSDAIAEVITGTKSLKEAFGDVAKSIIADLIRVSIRMLILRAISAAFGGGLGQSIFPVVGGVDPLAPLPGGVPGFARGGSFNVMGRRGIDKNVLSLNGLPMANVNYGEKVSIGNDNAAGPSRVIIELNDGMLDARIADGSQVQIVRAYPGISAGIRQQTAERGRRSP